MKPKIWSFRCSGCAAHSRIVVDEGAVFVLGIAEDVTPPDTHEDPIAPEVRAAANLAPKPKAVVAPKRTGKAGFPQPMLECQKGCGRVIRGHGPRAIHEKLCKHKRG